MTYLKLSLVKSTLCFALLLIDVKICFSQNATFTESAEAYGINVPPSTFPTLGTGVSFYDFNLDGIDDVTITGGINNASRFFQSTGDSLNEVHFQLCDIQPYYQTSFLWVDFNNDRQLDYSCTSSNGPFCLSQQTVPGSFEEVTQSSGMTSAILGSYSAAWADYDLDGLLDVYISNRDPSGPFGNRKYLYRNLGNNQFEDVTYQAMVADSQGISYQVLFTDIDKDGYPDIYIANDKPMNHNTMYRNLGNGTFEDISDPETVGLVMDGMGIAPGDFDNDGDEDLYVTNSPQSTWDFGGNVFFNNQGEEEFEDIGGSLGLRVYETSWGCSFADFNNDGHLDLFVANIGETGNAHNSLFMNVGNGTFYEDTLSDIFSTIGNSYGSAVGDVNNDGYPDILVINENPAEVKLWINNGGTNHWAKFILEGIGNSQGIGAWVEVYANESVQYRYNRCGVSFCSQDGRALMFGIGNETEIDSVRVVWPYGNTDTYYDILVNQTNTLAESVSVITSLQTEDLSRSIKAYPNPSESIFNIEWTNESHEVLGFQIINQNGQQVKSWSYSASIGQNKTMVSTSGLPSGMYQLVCSGPNVTVWQHSLLVK